MLEKHEILLRSLSRFDWSKWSQGSLANGWGYCREREYILAQQDGKDRLSGLSWSAQASRSPCRTRKRCAPG